MRIIHTSDWHLGQFFYGKSRANEHQQFLSWLLEQIQRHRIDAVIVAGDIFDTATPPSYAREMYFSFISQIQALNCQLIILAGNHDSVAMLGESQQLLASLSTHVVTHATPITDAHSQLVTIENADQQALAIVCAIPFIRPRDVIKSTAGQSASEKQHSLQHAITLHYQELFDQAKKMADAHFAIHQEKLPIIATGHLTALGVSMSDSHSDSVRDIYIGSLEAFPSSAFPSADYIALGHIHRAQQVGKSDHIRYSGSPIALSFDEAKQGKCVLMVEFNAGNLASIEKLPIPCFQPMALIKTKLDQVTQAVEQVVSQVSSSEPIWLDIEIESSEHLTDLQDRITTLIADNPVEVLRVRRSKQARKLLQQTQGIEENSTLNELSYQDVFDSRLSHIEWQTDEEIARKKRLQHLFKQTLMQVEAQAKQPLAEPNLAEASQVSSPTVSDTHGLVEKTALTEGED